MSVAIMVHKEANGVDGGFLDPAGGIGAVDTFFARKLNTLLVNQSATVVAFDGAAYTFTLGPGIYRIEAAIVFNPAIIATAGLFGYCAGLFNVTTAAFEVYTGGTEPILASTGFTGRATSPLERMDSNQALRLSGQFTVSSSNKTYQIRHKTNNAFPSGSWATFSTFCGSGDQCSTNSNVNGAKSSNFYMVVKIGRES